MKNFISIVFVGSVIVLVFNTAGSLAATWLDFDDSSLAIPSALIYSAIGFVASKVIPVSQAVVAIVLIGLVELTFSWAVSSWIQIGRLPIG